jgi:hypothetical protein
VTKVWMTGEERDAEDLRYARLGPWERCIEQESAHQMRVRRTLDVVGRLGQMEWSRKPHIVMVYSQKIIVQYFGVEERKDYLRITGMARQNLEAAKSNWVQSGMTQVVTTEGTIVDGMGDDALEIDVEVQVFVGLRPGCTLEWETVEVQRPKIVCA